MTSTEKRSKTVEERYGVQNIAQLQSTQNKRRTTFEAKKTTMIFYQEPRVNIIQAADLRVFKIHKKVADQWLDEYHPFKAPRGNVLCLGLVDQNTIYCLITFKRSRNPKYTAEISRMWMLPTWYVVGGYDKLSSSASEFGLYNLVAYVNMSFENYKDYEAIGMRHVRDIQPTKWWMSEIGRISDASRRQKHLSQDYMIFHGYVPMYDCGQRVYEV